MELMSSGGCGIVDTHEQVVELLIQKNNTVYPTPLSFTPKNINNLRVDFYKINTAWSASYLQRYDAGFLPLGVKIAYSALEFAVTDAYGAGIQSYIKLAYNSDTNAIDFSSSADNYNATGKLKYRIYEIK